MTLPLAQGGPARAHRAEGARGPERARNATEQNGARNRATRAPRAAEVRNGAGRAARARPSVGGAGARVLRAAARRRAPPRAIQRTDAHRVLRLLLLSSLLTSSMLLGARTILLYCIIL